MSSDIIVPKRIQIEVVFGCNAHCCMCPIDMPTDRKKGTMAMELFRKVADDLAPYNEQIEKVDLWGLGEPLLDRTIFDKISYLKAKGYRNIAIATNGDLLDAQRQDKILDSGLDTVIFSIDGVNKETHEAIRGGVDFDRVTDNARDIIHKRDRAGYKTRFVMRFIRQKNNIDEWKAFKNYWENVIDRGKKDMIIGYDMHSWGGEIRGDGNPGGEGQDDISDIACHHLWDRFMVFWDGRVPLCCSDLHHGQYVLGDVNDHSPIQIFNGRKITGLREIHSSGNKNSIKICRECNILSSEKKQEIIA
ncbi:MAG: radical SAM protein [Candidatus Omnitrophica bacterium]|nr:radical SAM protein [Candidatus Omnitrophota bacterium]